MLHIILVERKGMKTKHLLIAGIVFLFTIVILASSGYAAIDPKSIIALWLMDENKDNIAVDSSTNGNNGELKNGAKWGKGKFDGALELNGLGAYVELGVNNNLKPEQFTLVAWFNTRKVNGYGHIFQSGKDWDNMAGIVFRVHQDGSFQAAMATGPGNTASWCSGPNPAANKWYHAALTFDGTTLLLYMDGEKVANAGGGKIFYDDRTVRIGVHPDDTGSAFDGLIDEIALFNKALIQEDIQGIMNKGLGTIINAKAVFSAGKLATTWSHVRIE
jgi:hypothetical protein